MIDRENVTGMVIEVEPGLECPKGHANKRMEIVDDSGNVIWVTCPICRVRYQVVLLSIERVAA